MIWIILFLLSLIIVKIYWRISDGGVFVLPMIFGVIIIILSILAIEVYPDLLSQRAEVLSIKSEIETIRGAYYSQTNSGSLIGGSLDNIKQSTELSKYISSYAQMKSKFNKELVRQQVLYKNPFYFWFENSILIDKRILKIEQIQ